MDTSDASRVFISYSHDSLEHKRQVLALSNQLRGDGIDCNIDQYESTPPEGWPKWMTEQITTSDFVLVVCTKVYHRRVTGQEKEGKGLGASWEGGLITQEIYEAGGQNAKFIPVILKDEDVAFVPSFLKPTTYYDLSRPGGYEELYRRLTSQPVVVKPPLGTRRTLPPTEPPSTGTFSIVEPKHGGAVSDKEKSDIKWANLVLLKPSRGDVILVRSQRVETGEVGPIFGKPGKITLELLPDDAKTSAALSSLGKAGNNKVSVAYGSTAHMGTVMDLRQVVDEGREVWVVMLQPDNKAYGGSISEIAFEGYSPDDIAELRARRILLDEEPPKHGRSSRDRINKSMLESLVEGMQMPIQVTKSPFPDLFKTLGDDPDFFLAASRLFGVLWLKLSGVVEHILKLDLSLDNATALHIDFRGQRQRVYQNTEPTIISVEGQCNLVPPG